MHDFLSMPAGRARFLRLAGAAVIALGLAACGGEQSQAEQGGGQQQRAPIPVDVMNVEPHRVNVFSEYPGRVEGQRTVQVLARVEGVLLERHYTEGQIVEKGDLLYNIDPKPFQATVNQRQAELGSARASLNQAQRQWSRTRQLYEADAVSEAERDQALSEIETARAAVDQAQANLESAEIDLGYTTVNAPLTGVTSLREIDEGALVSNGTRLTTITQLDPVQVLFALPEDDAIARGKALSAMGDETTDDKTREATIILPDGSEFPVKGVVDFTQSTINPDTGTVQLRATVDNPDNGLMPGRYVRARIRLETRENGIVVPEQAVSDGNQGTQVYVVADGKAKAVDVDLGPTVEEGRLINDGLSAGDRVITSGLGQVTPDAPVKVKSDGSGGSEEGTRGGGGGSGMGRAGSEDDDGGLAAADLPALRLTPREPLTAVVHDDTYAVNGQRNR